LSDFLNKVFIFLRFLLLFLCLLHELIILFLCLRLLYRSRQRGFLELDLVLGKWVEEHIYSMDENGVKALIDVLDLVNNNSPSLHLLVSMSFYD